MKIEQNSFGNLNFRHDWLDSLPRPLAYTYARLIEEIESKEPIAAAWALRDAWDCAIRLTACLALADLIAAKPPEKKLHEVMEVLFKVSGVSLGDWARLVAIGCDGKIKTEHPRLLPKLTHFYRTERGLLTPIGNLLSGGQSPSLFDEPELDDVALLGPGKVNIVTWRNKVMAHGVFRRNRSWYVAQIVQWVPALHQYYEALMPALEGWTLCEGDTASTLLMGMGASDPVGTHQHVSTEAAHTVVLTGSAGTLSFGPLLSAQRCAICGERHIFFYDRSQRNKSGPDALRTELLDYLAGHIDHRRGWPPALDWENYLAGQLEQDHAWQRQAVSQQELAEQTRSVFNRFADSYMRPDWIMDQLWNEIDTLERGYVHLEAPAGTGKSYLARALKEQESPARGLPALLYHIQPGLRADYRTFIMLLGDEAKEQLNARTQEIQAKDQGIAGLRQQFIEFFDYLKCANRLDSLLLVIDGLDELPARVEPSEFAITDFLPPAGELPKGCVVVLTGRSNLREGIADQIERVATESGSNYRKIVLNPGNPSNLELLIAYTLTSLPEKLREQTLAERIVERAKGIFLYTFHLVQALNAGAFSTGEELPAAEVFYQAYLSKLRERVGDGLYEEIYLKLLLFLAAVGGPVTLDQLKSWGLRADRLDSALLDIADFIDEVRWRPWHERVDDTDERPRYRIARAEFLDFLKGDPDLGKQLSEAKMQINSILLRRLEGGWNTLDETSEDDTFDVQFILNAANGQSVIQHLNFSTLAICAQNLAMHLYEKQRWTKAEGMLVQAVLILRRLVEQEGRQDLANDLACALSSYGAVLSVMHRLDEAETCHGESISILRRLVEQEGRQDLADALVASLNNYGTLLEEMKRLDEAETTYAEGIKLRHQLVKRDERDLAYDRAIIVSNQGALFLRLKRPDEAEACQAEAVVILRHVVELADQLKLINVMADVRNALSREQFKAGQLQECVDKYLLELGLLERRMVEWDGREALANALSGHGAALAALNRLDEAEVRLAESISILRQLIFQEGRQGLAANLATAQSAHGLVLWRLNRLDAAETSLAKSVTILRRFVEQESRQELASDLSNAMIVLGHFLGAVGKLKSSKRTFLEVVALLENVLTRCQDPDAKTLLVDALCGVINTCADMKDWQGVLEAHGSVEALTGKGNWDAIFALKLLSDRGRARVGMGNLVAALSDFEDGIALASRTSDDPDAMIWRDGLIYRRASALATQEDPKADDACDETLKIWRNRFDSEPNETNIHFFARSLILNSRRDLKNGMPITAFEIANEATKLLATLVPKHWRYREPLAEALNLAAEASEELMQFETSATLRDEAQKLLVPPIEE